MEQSEKRALRREILSHRNAIPPETRAVKSQTICQQLCQLAELRHVCTVAVYSAMGSEVDLDLFIRSAYESGMRVAFPAVLPDLCDGQRMEMRAVDEADCNSGAAPFVTNPVPAFTATAEQNERFPLVDPEGIGMIIVPLVAFDDAGNRLGYGGGCYDRYLPALSTSCAILGAAFTEQKIPAVPIGEHDRSLPLIVCA